MSDTHPVDQLDQWEFDDKAAMAVSMLAGFGHAFVDLQPRDATTYKIVVVNPMHAVHPHESNGMTGWVLARQVYWVGTSFGQLYQFSPKNDYHWTYVLDHWLPYHSTRSTTAEWTARVLARFLNTLADKMREG